MGNFESVIFYIVSFCMSMFFLYLSEHTERKTRKKIFIFIGLLIPILVSGLRWEVGTDFKNYMSVYNHFEILDLSEYELMFIGIVRISKFLGDIQYLFLIYAVLTVFFVYKALKSCNNGRYIFLTFGVYLFLNFTTSFNIMRQSLAVAIVFYSYKYIFERKFVKFILLILFASLAHTTALLCIPIYFLVPKQEKDVEKVKFVQVASIVAICVIVLNYNSVLGLLTSVDRFEKYSHYLDDVGSSNLSVVVGVIFVVLFLVLRKKMVKFDSKNSVYILLFIISVILELSGFYSPFVKRISVYFSMSLIYLIGSLPMLSSEKKTRLLIIFCILLYIVSMFYLTKYVIGFSEIIPYKSVFKKI